MKYTAYNNEIDTHETLNIILYCDKARNIQHKNLSYTDLNRFMTFSNKSSTF